MLKNILLRVTQNRHLKTGTIKYEAYKELQEGLGKELSGRALA
jgi:hypothetical protein